MFLYCVKAVHFKCLFLIKNTKIKIKSMHFNYSHLHEKCLRFYRQQELDLNA